MSQALLKAVMAGRPKHVRFLLKSGISTEESDETGHTPLIKAVFVENEKAREKIMKLLLTYGCLVNRTDLTGRTALCWACIFGRSEDVRILLDHAEGDIDANKRDNNGQTALFLAALSGNASIVKLLVEHLVKYRLSVEVEDHSGISPLTCALKLGHDVCASILVRQGQAQGGLDMYHYDNQSWRKRYTDPFLRTVPKNIALTSELGFSQCHSTSKRQKHTFDNPNHNKRYTGMANVQLGNTCVNSQFCERKNTHIKAVTPDFLNNKDVELINTSEFLRFDGSKVSEESWQTDFMDISDENCTAVESKSRLAISRLSLGARSTSSASTASSVEEGVDRESYPLNEIRKSDSIAEKLHGIYNVYQEEKCLSFRPSATPLPPPPSLVHLTDQNIQSFVSDAVSSRSLRSAKDSSSQQGNDSLHRALTKKNGTTWSTHSNRTCDDKILRRKSKKFERSVLPAILDKN